MRVELPTGDVVDKITILKIKSERISDPAKLVNIHAELDELVGAWGETEFPPLEELPEWEGLLRVNGELWVIEDDLRELEAAQDFSDAFVQAARSVYFTNDRRAELKKSVNISLGSALVEEKSYADYGAGSGVKAAM
jgi:hypothetical protein